MVGTHCSSTLTCLIDLHIIIVSLNDLSQCTSGTVETVTMVRDIILCVDLSDRVIYVPSSIHLLLGSGSAMHVCLTNTLLVHYSDTPLVLPYPEPSPFGSPYI